MRQIVFMIFFTLFSASCAPIMVEGETISEATKAFEKGEFDRAYNLLLPYARGGNADAQFSVGLIIANGFGEKSAKMLTPQQREELAWPWIDRAAKGGNTRAMDWVADAYESGWAGLELNEKAAKCWRAASNGKRSPTSCR
jgi:TPR repeat protein